MIYVIFSLWSMTLKSWCQVAIQRGPGVLLTQMKVPENSYLFTVSDVNMLRMKWKVLTEKIEVFEARVQSRTLPAASSAVVFCFRTTCELPAVQNKRREHSNLRQTPNFTMDCDEFLQPLEARGHEIRYPEVIPLLWCPSPASWSWSLRI